MATYDYGVPYDSSLSYDADPVAITEVAKGLQPSLGIELRIYDKLNPTQLIDIIDARLDPQYLEERKGPGGGSFRIRINDQKIIDNPSILDPRNVVQVRVGNRVVGSWLIQRQANRLIGSGEFAEQVYEVSGPGVREWLKDAIVFAPIGAPSTVGGARGFNFATARGTWYNPTEWTTPVNMSRADAGKILSDITVAQAMQPGVSDDAPAKSPDGYPKASKGWKNGYQLYGSTTAVTPGWGFPGYVVVPAGSSKYWWDANGWHTFTSSTSSDPPPVTPDGGTRYPTAVAPGIVVYGYVNPVTGVWSNIGVDAATTKIIADKISHTYWSPKADALRYTSTEPRDYRTTQTVKEPAPPGWKDDNPWKGGPKDWPAIAPHARWMWDRDTRFAVSGQRAPIGDVYFRREFTITTAGKYELFISADNQFVAYIDSLVVSSSSPDQNAAIGINKTEVELTAGTHVLGIKATNWEVGIAGLLVVLGRPGDPDVSNRAVQFATPVLVSGDDGWVCQGYPASPPGWSVGEVLRTLVSEAAARGVNSMSRLSLSFTDDADSEGVPWGAPMDWSFDLGTDYAEVVTKIEELSAEIVLRTNQDGTFTLDAFLERGTDKSNAASSDVIILRPGLNVTDATEDGEFVIKNSLLVSSKDGWFETSDAVNSTSLYGRIEGYLNVAGTKTLAQNVATATFNKMALPLTSTSVGFIPSEDAVPWVDFVVGDWVLGPTQNKTLIKRRISSIALSENNVGTAYYACEFDTISQDRLDKIERWLKSTADGTLGGSIANASGAGSSTPAPSPVISGALAYEPTSRPFSNTELVGQIIDGANIIDGTLIAGDKMVANSVTVELLQADVLTATNIRSGTLTADVIMGGQIRTANEESPLWPARAEMNATGFHAFDAAGLEVFTADLFGSVRVAGVVESTTYVQGQTGWHFGTENTQFETLNVINDVGASLVTADSIILGLGVNGVDVGTNLGVEILPAMSQGLVMFATSRPWTADSAAISTETAILKFLPPTLYGARYYMFKVTAEITPSAASSVWRLLIRYTTDGTEPSVAANTQILDMSASDYQASTSGNRIRAEMTVFYTPSVDYNDWRGILTLQLIAGTGTCTVRFVDDNLATQVAVVDMGLQANVLSENVLVQKSVASGGSATSTTTTTTYTKSWSADWSKSFGGDGDPRSPDTDDLYQGRYSSTHGNTRSMFGFGDLSGTLNNPGGSTITITKVTFTFRVKHSYHSAGLRVRVSGYHNYSSRSGATSFVNTGSELYDAGSTNKKEGTTYTVTLSNDSSFLAALKGGTAKGLSIGPGEDTGTEWYGYLYGANVSSKPKITVTYNKTVTA